jgi:hypothetical protein
MSLHSHHELEATREKLRILELRESLRTEGG